jgi:hypothetical protein
MIIGLCMSWITKCPRSKADPIFFRPLIHERNYCLNDSAISTLYPANFRGILSSHSRYIDLYGGSGTFHYFSTTKNGYSQGITRRWARWCCWRILLQTAHSRCTHCLLTFTLSLFTIFSLFYTLISLLKNHLFVVYLTFFHSYSPLTLLCFSFTSW